MVSLAFPAVKGEKKHPGIPHSKQRDSVAGGQLLNQSGRENSSTQEPPRQLRTGKFCSFAREQLPGASWGEGSSTQCPTPIPGSCCSQPLQTWLGMDKSCRILRSHHGAGHNPPHSLELQPSRDGREPPAAPRVLFGSESQPSQHSSSHGDSLLEKAELQRWGEEGKTRHIP